MSEALLGSERRARLEAARLYLVSGSKPAGRELEQVLPAAAAGGVRILQLREKDADDERLAFLGRGARRLCEQLGVLFIVNDRPRAALALGADGVHLGQDDMPVEEARELVGREMLIGLSTHTSGEIEAARAVSADYIGVGPVHATPTKPGRAPVGLELVRHAAAHWPRPFFAIGGIAQSNVAEVIDAGAERVAVVRAIAQSTDPQRAARSMHDTLCGQLAPTAP